MWSDKECSIEEADIYQLSGGARARQQYRLAALQDLEATHERRTTATPARFRQRTWWEENTRDSCRAVPIV
jgi:hypothetical protein